MAVEMSIQEYIRERSDRDGFETAMFIYQSALTQMGSRIEVLNSELNHMHSYNPIEYVKSRLKTPESIMKKLRKNGHNLNIEDMIEYVNDIAGIRITCSFFSEIYFVADMIARQDNLEGLYQPAQGKRLQELSYAFVHSGSVRRCQGSN